MPSIATLVPAYNAARHIEQALNSVAAQTRLPDEIVVVDDGSTDATANIVSHWSTQHPHLTLRLVQQSNGGASAARNTAILAADSEFIAFLDADDLYEPSHHAKLAAALAQHPALAVAFGQQSVFTEQGEICANFLHGKPIEQVSYDEQPDGLRLLTDHLWAALIQGNFIPTSGSMARRQTVLDAGLMDTQLKTSEDRDLWLRVSRLGQLAYLPERVAQKREHDSNLTGDANAAIVQRYAVDVIQKQIDNAVQLKLTTEELAASHRALNTAINAFLYEASRKGLGAYRTQLRQLHTVKSSHWEALARSWVRAALVTLRGDADSNHLKGKK